MYNDTKLKTFVNPNHLILESDFNLWTSTLDAGIHVVNTTLTYSAALQKFVMAVVYTEATNTDQFQVKV